MKNAETKKNIEGGTGDITNCSVCAEYFNSNEAFFCPKCKKGPLCKKHRLPGRKECRSCSFDGTLKEVNILRWQVKSIKSFINFLQFLFLTFAIIFIASTFGLLEEIAYFKENLIIKNMPYFGIGTAVLLIYFISSCQIRSGKLKKSKPSSGKSAAKDISFVRSYYFDDKDTFSVENCPNYSEIFLV